MLNMNSVMIGSQQGKALAAFYEKVFGRAPDFNDAESGFYGWKLGGGYMGVLQHSEINGPSKDPNRVMLNFDTAEVQQEFERIKGVGAKVIRAPYAMGGGLIATLADPEGNYFQLMTPMEM